MFAKVDPEDLLEISFRKNVVMTQVWKIMNGGAQRISSRQYHRLKAAALS